MCVRRHTKGFAPLDCPIVRSMDAHNKTCPRFMTPYNTLGPHIGFLDHDFLVRVDRSLAVFLGFV